MAHLMKLRTNELVGIFFCFFSFYGTQDYYCHNYAYLKCNNNEEISPKEQNNSNLSIGTISVRKVKKSIKNSYFTLKKNVFSLRISQQNGLSLRFGKIPAVLSHFFKNPKTNCFIVYFVITLCAHSHVPPIKRPTDDFLCNR